MQMFEVNPQFLSSYYYYPQKENMYSDPFSLGKQEKKDKERNNFLDMIGKLAMLYAMKKAPIRGGVGGVNTGYQQTPMGIAPTWSPYDATGRRVF